MLLPHGTLHPFTRPNNLLGRFPCLISHAPGAWRCKVPSWPQLDRLDTVVFISGRFDVVISCWSLKIGYLFIIIYLMLLCISLPNDFRLIFIKQMVHNIAMPFYGTSKLVSKTSRDDAPCPPRGLFDAPSRSCWQLEPLKKERPSGHAIAGIPTVSVWPNPRRNACLMRFGRSMAVSMPFVLSSIWERCDNMYLRCQKVSTLHEEYSKIYVIHIFTYLYSIWRN